MAKFTKIARMDAPEPSKTSGRVNVRMRQYEDYVQSIKVGDVGKLQIEGNETPRGIAMRLSRAARRTNVAIDTWTVDNSVYFQLR